MSEPAALKAKVTIMTKDLSSARAVACEEIYSPRSFYLLLACSCAHVTIQHSTIKGYQHVSDHRVDWATGEKARGDWLSRRPQVTGRYLSSGERLPARQKSGEGRGTILPRSAPDTNQFMFL